MDNPKIIAVPNNLADQIGEMLRKHNANYDILGAGSLTAFVSQEKEFSNEVTKDFAEFVAARQDKFKPLMPDPHLISLAIKP